MIPKLTKQEATNLENAWRKAQDFKSPGARGDGYYVTRDEFHAIVDAAKLDDGKVSKAEADEIVYKSLEGYTDFTTGGLKALDAFEKCEGINPRNLSKKIFG